MLNALVRANEFVLSKCLKHSALMIKFCSSRLWGWQLKRHGGRKCWDGNWFLLLCLYVQMSRSQKTFLAKAYWSTVCRQGSFSYVLFWRWIMHYFLNIVLIKTSS